MKTGGLSELDILKMYKALKLAYELAIINDRQWITVNEYRFQTERVNDAITIGYGIKHYFDDAIQPVLVQLRGKMLARGYTEKDLDEIECEIAKDIQKRLDTNGSFNDETPW